MKKSYVTIATSKKHHELLTYMIILISMTRKESKVSLIERLIVAYAKQLTMSIRDESYRGKLLSLINEAEEEKRIREEANSIH